MRKGITTYPQNSGLTDKQAQEMLSKLRTHYNQPVLPLGQVCNAIYDWTVALRDLAKRSKDANDKYFHGSEYVDRLSHILVDINKSALLFRLLYLGEDLRTEMCPVHKGELEMFIWLGAPDAGDCACGGTGWLPNQE